MRSHILHVISKSHPSDGRGVVSRSIVFYFWFMNHSLRSIIYRSWFTKHSLRVIVIVYESWLAEADVNPWDHPLRHRLLLRERKTLATKIIIPEVTKPTNSEAHRVQMPVAAEKSYWNHVPTVHPTYRKVWSVFSLSRSTLSLVSPHDFR